MAYSISEDCLGCGECAKVCKVAAIKGKPEQRYVVENELCNACGECADACKNGAILNDLGEVVGNSNRIPAVDIEKCTDCQLCIESCPANVLELCPPKRPCDTEIYAIVAWPENCRGDGLCTQNCPVGAITLKERD